MDTPSLTGSFPNVFYQAISMDTLRRSPDLFALPPTDSIHVVAPSSYRYIRQDDPLWEKIHAGRLTSGYLAGALGLLEPTAAKRLKISKSKVSHGRLLEVYQHLSQPLYLPTPRPKISEEAAALHNARVTVAFNDEASQRIGRELLGQQPICDGNAPRGNSYDSFGAISEGEKLKKAHSIGSQGLQAVRCAWGRAQESSTLRVLNSIFKESQIVEVGLCVLEERTLPKEWGFDPGTANRILPAIGASPDALIIHPPGPLPAFLPNFQDDFSNDDEVDGHSTLGHVGEQTDRTFAPAQRKSCPLHLDTLLTLQNSNFEGSGVEVEVVEVKNSPPFDYSQTARSKKGRRKFVVCDRGPRSRIDPLWIPQLQLHMLCAGASSALLVSRSATRGVRVFRVAADAPLQRLMLCMLRKLWVEYVLPNQTPPLNVFTSGDGAELMNGLVRKIREGVAAAVVVAELSGKEARGFLKGTDSRFFLD